MTTELPDTHRPMPADQPLALRSNEGLGAVSEARCACLPLECNARGKCPDNCAAMIARRELLAADNRTTVDAGALAMALHVLRRAGKMDVAAALQDSAKRCA